MNHEPKRHLLVIHGRDVGCSHGRFWFPLFCRDSSGRPGFGIRFFGWGFYHKWGPA